MDHTMQESTEIWDRVRGEASDEIGDGVYNLIIGLTLSWGFAINFLMIKYIPVEVFAGVPRFMLFIGYFISCMAGISLYQHSTKPAVSFLGYNLVVLPFGVLLNLIVSGFAPQVVGQAIQMTAIVTGVMMALGTAFPAFFKSIGRGLTIALVVVIVVELIAAFFFHARYSILDYAVALIFCGYIGYDWGRANQLVRTVDNAIDSAAALYMDIINLFVRLLRIFGDRR
jgi:FtsH-binding integral membrane protein